MRLTLALVLLAVGCGTDEPPADPDHPPADPCDALACNVNQQACVVTEGTAACQPCGVGEYAAGHECRPISGVVLTHDFPEQTTEAGGELLGLCRSWTLDNATELFVNAVEIEQDESSHHSNWTFVPDTEFAGPDGIWLCDDRQYSQLVAALAGGVLYAQSTQATHEVQKFPDGVVVRVPAHARIISDIHTLNATADAVTGHMRINIYTIDPAAVTVKLAPFHLSYDGLALPPLTRSRFSGDCELDSFYQNETGAPFAPQVYYLLPHTHALGRRMFIQTLGGARDGETLIDVEGFNGEARGRAFDPPIDMSGALGMRFGCEFDNPRPETVVWGFGDKEMCEALGFAASPLAFESRIDEALTADAGDMPSFTGACGTLALPWDK